MRHTALWTSNDKGWQLVAPSGFPDEKALHGLVEEAPHMLPLAGSPALTVVGREVQLGAGYADLVAIESSGRIAIIEVKLFANAESRRAIVGQVLAYAAYLHRSSLAEFEELLASHLGKRNFSNLTAAVSSITQAERFDESEFIDGLTSCLETGSFRFVLVLDEAPEELVSIVGYLESVTSGLTIDLITVSAYQINGTPTMVPHRVEPERHQTEYIQTPSPPKQPKGFESPGTMEFEASIDSSPVDRQAFLKRLLGWAVELEKLGLVRLSTYRSPRLATLLPRIPDAGVGLVTVYNDTGSAYLALYRSVFEKRAPNTLKRLEDAVAPTQIRQGSTIPEVSDEILLLLTAAYQEAAGASSADEKSIIRGPFS